METQSILDYLNDIPASVKTEGFWNGPDNCNYYKLHTLVWDIGKRRSIKIEMLERFNGQIDVIRKFTITSPRWYNLFTKKVNLKIKDIYSVDYVKIVRITNAIIKGEKVHKKYIDFTAL